jgi:hypothetical protein
MRRREFISVIAGAAIWPLRARAEQPAMPVIGFLDPAPAAEAIAPAIAAFRRGLAEGGHVEGKNLAIEYRFANFGHRCFATNPGRVAPHDMPAWPTPSSGRRIEARAHSRRARRPMRATRCSRNAT